ncbi:MAG: aromatic ring-hydroxylating dioxygenase subunit alpha [Polyangiaceae bacterium]
MVEGHPIDVPLEEAWTAPSSWYTDPRVAARERAAVFGATWQLFAREDQLRSPGDYVSGEVAGEPIVVTRGKGGVLRGFFNVCRHHAAAVMTEPCGNAARLKCPYHGWTYGLDGALQSATEFEGARGFHLADHGLVPVDVDVWQGLVFVRVERGTTTPPSRGLADELGDVGPQVDALGLEALTFHERREWELACNWKVFVDNYLDGGYHVPFLHRTLNQAISYSSYAIEPFARACLQSSPIEESAVGAIRAGRAFYLWIYPNLMLNAYDGYLDTNLVVPIDAERTRVIFDFYFAPGTREEDRRASVELACRIQEEDEGICASVQRGLRSRAYDRGRLSPRREAGEHLFHRLLAKDLLRGGSW